MKEDICLFVRHSAAEDTAPGADDLNTDLTQAGRAQAAALRDWLYEREIKIDTVWSSPALRAIHTAKIISSPRSRKVILHEALYGDVDIRSSSRTYLQKVPGTTLIVGHDQNLQSIAYLMSGRHLSLRHFIRGRAPLPYCGMFEVRLGPTDKDVSVRMVEWQ